MRTMLALFLLGGLAAGDVVHLRNGGKIEGKVTPRGDKVEVETLNGVVTVDRADVERIEKKDFALPGGTRRSNVRLGSPYAHPFYAFKIYLPPKWEHGKSHGQSAASFWGPKEQAYQPRIDLHYQVTPTDLPDLVAKYKEAFAKSFQKLAYVSEGAFATQGKVGYQFSATFAEGDPPIYQQALFTFVADGKRKYVMSFNCTQNWYDRYAPSVDASMRSIRIYAEPAATREQKNAFIQCYSRAFAAYKEGKHKEALGDFREAARLIPEYADIHSTIGTIQMKLGNYADAEQALRKAISLDPEDYSHHYNLGICLLKQSKHDPAIETLKKAVALDPTAEPVLTNLGAAYLARDLLEPARDALEKAIAADPESAPAHYNLGVVYERQGKAREAEREFKQALSANPAHKEAKEGLERVRGKK